MVTPIAPEQCTHHPTDRGFVAHAGEHPPFVWCFECREYVEIDVDYALEFWHDHALEEVFRHRVVAKAGAAAWEPWQAANWATVLQRLEGKPRGIFQKLLTPH